MYRIIILVIALFAICDASAENHPITSKELSPCEAIRYHYTDVRQLAPIEDTCQWSNPDDVFIAKHFDESIWEYRYMRIKTGTNGNPKRYHRIKKRMLFDSPPQPTLQGGTE